MPALNYAMPADGRAAQSTLSRSMKEAKDDDLTFVTVDLMDNNVGKSCNGPFKGIAHGAGMAEMRKFCEPIAIGKDAPYLCARRPLDYDAQGRTRQRRYE